MTQSTNTKCEWLILGVPVGESCAISTSGRESDRTGNTAKKEQISVSRGVADVGTKMGEERERDTHLWILPCGSRAPPILQTHWNSPYCSVTVANQSQRTAAPTHNAADSLSSYCCAGQWVCSFTPRECKREPNPLRVKESMMEGLMDLWPG